MLKYNSILLFVSKNYIFVGVLKELNQVIKTL
jgi:hypothetical protein